MIRVFAPAKINLALHVTGQRADGYHLLDMLVAFADVGDDVTLEPAATPSLSVTGAALTGPNILDRVLRDFATRPYAVTLDKRLPVASGMGGGSADAAALYRGILSVQGRAADPAELLPLGADVPICVTSQAARVRGIGDDILPLPQMAALSVLLVNPRLPLATPAVFAALTTKQNSGLAPLPDDLGDVAGLIQYLQTQRNDLQPAAIGLAPVIAEVLAEISQTGAVLARMSGSGATCFGIYPDPPHQAAAQIRARHPDWWITTATLNGPPNIAPQAIRATT